MAMGETDPVRGALRRAQAGDGAARAQVVQANLGLVRSIAARFVRLGHEGDDLFQVGVIGLIKAVDRFDLDRPVQFSTYAVPLILGEMRRFLRDDGTWSGTRALKERWGKLQAVAGDLAQRQGREPTAAELAAALGWSAEQVAEVLATGRSLAPWPPDTGGKHRPGTGTDTAPRWGSDDFPTAASLAAGRSEGWVDRLALHTALDRLPPMDRAVLLLRYMGGYSQGDAGRRLGLSQVQVSRRERRALAAMRIWLADA